MRPPLHAALKLDEGAPPAGATNAAPHPAAPQRPQGPGRLTPFAAAGEMSPSPVPRWATLHFRSDAFLRHQVRHMAAAVAAVLTDGRQLPHFLAALADDRPYLGPICPPAPAHHLVLADVAWGPRWQVPGLVRLRA